MNKTFFKQVKIAAFIVCIFFVVAIVYFLFFYSNKDIEDKQKNLSVRFNSSDIILLKNTLPISDQLGKDNDGNTGEESVQPYLEFSVKNLNNKSMNYDIILTQQFTEKNQIKDNYVKLYLTDDKDTSMDGFQGNFVPTFYDFYYLTDKPSSKLLFSDSLEKGESKTYRLRVWLSDRYSISFEPEEFSFDVDVLAK